MSMRSFIILSGIFILAAQIPAFVPERYGWKWTLAGTLLVVGVSCLIAGIFVALIED
jgi:hypothetical protein